MRVLAGLRNCCTFASHLRGMPAERQKNAAIAQLVERNLAKVEVAGPSPVCRSLFEQMICYAQVAEW